MGPKPQKYQSTFSTPLWKTPDRNSHPGCRRDGTHPKKYFSKFFLSARFPQRSGGCGPYSRRGVAGRITALWTHPVAIFDIGPWRSYSFWRPTCNRFVAPMYPARAGPGYTQATRNQTQSGRKRKSPAARKFAPRRRARWDPREISTRKHHDHRARIQHLPRSKLSHSNAFSNLIIVQSLQG